MGNILEAAFTWIFNTMKMGVEAICVFILDLFFNEGDIFSLQTVTGSANSSIVSTVSNVGRFAPTIKYFRNNVIGNNSSGLYDTIVEIMTWVSLALVIIFVFFSLAQLVMGSVIEMRSTVASILARGFVAAMLVFWAPDIAQWALDVGLEMLMYIFVGIIQYFTGNFDSLMDAFLNVDDIVSAAMLENQSVGSILGISALPNLLNLLISSVLLIVVAYNFIKAAFEIIQHYVLMGTLVMFSPFSMAFIVSEDSQIVFRNYWKMLFTEIGLLVFNYLWLVVDLIVIANMDGVIGCIIALAVIRIGTQGNQLARSMGFCTSGMIGTLADSVSMAAMNTASVFGAAGNGMKALGSATNRMGLVRAGMMMNGQNTLSSSVAKEAQGNPLGGLFRQGMASRGGLAYNDSVKKNIEGCLTEGTRMSRAQAGKMLNDLTPEGRKAALRDLSASPKYAELAKAMEENGKKFQITDIGENGITFAGLDKNGGVAFTGQLSDYNVGGRGIPFTTPNGEQKYAILNKSDYDKPTDGSIIKPLEGEKYNGLSDLETKTGLGSAQLWSGRINADGTLRSGVNPLDYQFRKEGSSWIRENRKTGKAVAVWKGSPASAPGMVEGMPNIGRGRTQSMSDFLKQGGRIGTAPDGGIGLYMPAIGGRGLSRSTVAGHVKGYSGQSFNGARMLTGSDGSGTIYFADGTKGSVDRATADNIKAANMNLDNLAGLKADGNGMVSVPSFNGADIGSMHPVVGTVDYSGEPLTITGVDKFSDGTSAIMVSDSNGNTDAISGFDSETLDACGITDAKARDGALSINGRGQIIDSSAEAQYSGSLDDAVLVTDENGAYVETADGRGFVCSDGVAEQMEELGYQNGDSLYGCSAVARDGYSEINTPSLDENGEYLVGNIGTDGSITADDVNAEPDYYGVMNNGGVGSFMHAEEVPGSSEYWSPEYAVDSKNGTLIYSGQNWEQLSGIAGASIPYSSYDADYKPVESIDDSTAIRLMFAHQGETVFAEGMGGKSVSVVATSDGPMKGAFDGEKITEAYRTADDMFVIRHTDGNSEKVSYIGIGVSGREKLKSETGRTSYYEGNDDWGTFTKTTREVRKNDRIPGREDEEKYRASAGRRRISHYSDDAARKGAPSSRKASRSYMNRLRMKNVQEEIDTMQNP